MTGDGRAATESLGQLKLVWRALVEERGGDLGFGDGLVRLWADSAFPFWNTLTLADHRVDASSLERHLSGAADYMRGRRPGYLWLFADLLGDAAGEALAGLAQGAGLRRAMELRGMAGRVPPGPEPTHPELTFERVSTRAQLEAYADLNSRAYAMPPAAGRDGLCGSKLWTEGIFAFLALRAGVPVSAAATVPADGRLFVLLVATHPDAQRRGYGEAVTRKALHEGARATGIRRATLHATASGVPVYRRIGFAETAAIVLYDATA